MTSDRFDPKPSGHYAVCIDCDLTFETAQEAKSHVNETLASAREMAPKASRISSHSYRILNPSRESRIRSRVDDIVRDAIDEAINEVLELVARGDITHEEAGAALSDHEAFYDAFVESDD